MKIEDERLYEWSQNVKIRAHWCCEEPGCWVREKTILDAHHKKPKAEYPYLIYDPENGECLCLWHHAARHIGNVKNKILARLGEILFKRYYGVKNEKLEMEIKDGKGRNRNDSDRGSDDSFRW